MESHGDMKKHVLFIVENNSVPGDVRVWGEAKTLKEFGYDVSVISPIGTNSSEPYECKDGVEIYRHPKPVDANNKFGFVQEYANALLWELILSFRIYIKRKFHVIHAANPPDHIFLIALVFRLFKVKFIFDHHDISPENYLAKFGKKDLFYYVQKLLEKWTFKTADIVISTNESYKKIAVERGGKNPQNVFVVRNGPRLNEVEFLPANNKWKNNFKFLGVYVGVIGNQEGLDNLLRIVWDLANVHNVKTIKFVVVGMGPELNNMITQCKRMQLEDYIQFTGFIPYHDFYEVLASADFAVNPEYRNSFTDKSTMLKIMDYMTFGIPIVQFRTTEGMVTAGDAAVYVDRNSEKEFAQAITRLIGDNDGMKRMGEIGKRRITESLNWERQKEFLKKAYHTLWDR
jgi:glycosyltransferase involved in cell wall biosynthesis